MPICNSCHKPFADFKSLAQHIVANKKTHRKGIKWANKYLTRQQALDRKSTMQNMFHSPLSEEDKNNRDSMHRELSGRTKVAETICPKCKTVGISAFPIEFIEDSYTWKQGLRFVKFCVRCGGL